MSQRSDIAYVQICNSHRPKIAGGGCCSDRGAKQLLTEFKAYIKERNLEKRIEIVESGCIRNCAQGVSLRVISDMTLYGQVKIQDIEEIVQEHLLNGRIVERLKVKPISILDQF
ncbi:MAG: (2Fe-2S) ferredoxin domain-containing protein [Bacteroidota bacterium]